jgi:hypothetical protein
MFMENDQIRNLSAYKHWYACTTRILHGPKVDRLERARLVMFCVGPAACFFLLYVAPQHPIIPLSADTMWGQRMRHMASLQVA